MSFNAEEIGFTLPDGWVFKQISDVANINANTIKKATEPDYIYYIDISSVSTGRYEQPKRLNYKDAPSRAKRMVRNNDIIISTVRPNLRQYALLKNVSDNWIASTGFCVISPKNEESAWYLFSVITSQIFTEHLVRIADGGAYPAFNPKEIENAIIPWPEKTYLGLINNFVGSTEEKIENNRQMNKTLEGMAQAIFKSWFVDFDPVRAKVEALENGGSAEDARLAALQAISGKSPEDLARLKTQSPESYAELSATADAFPTAFTTSPLGNIPEGWEVKGLDQIANYLNGLALQKFRPKDESHFLPVLKIAQLKKGATDGAEKASPDIKPEYIVDNGDIVFSWSGSLVVDVWCGGKAALNQHLFKVTSDEYPKWLYYLYTRHHLQEFQRIAADKAVTMGHIKREHLSQALCAVPKLDSKLMDICGRALQNNLSKQIELRLECTSLAETRDALLPKLLSGEIDVSALNDMEEA